MKEFIAFSSPDDDPNATFRELSKAVADDGNVKMFKGEIGRVDSDFKFVGMNPADYELQHSTTPQPRLLDGDCATRDWPMPPAGKWVPRPQPQENPEHPEIAKHRERWEKERQQFESIELSPSPVADEEDAEVLRVRNMPHDPAEERNPIARALTRLINWRGQ